MLCQTLMASHLQSVPCPFSIHCWDCLGHLPQHYLKSSVRLTNIWLALECPCFQTLTMGHWFWYFKHENSNNIYLNFRGKKRNLPRFFFFFFLCLLCFITIHLPLNRTPPSCKSLRGDEVSSLNDALSVIIMILWGRRKKNRRARKLNFSSENRDVNSENI